MHEIWRKIRRPFRYPTCRACKWEVYDVNQAGCLKCGRQHFCHSNSVDSTCPLVTCDDRTRVCDITGYVLPEVRHAQHEYSDNVGAHTDNSKQITVGELDTEVYSVVASLLLGDRAKRCREQENAKQYARLAQHMHRQMRVFKLAHPGRLPSVCRLLAQAMGQERYWRFIEEASEDLVRHCARNIGLCLLQLRVNGTKMTSGTRLQDMVCGMLYMLKHGLIFKDRILLSAIPEVDRCLPHENKIEAYFGISSKVICMTENEVKLMFRETYQT
jgi:hypothetical protein